jgi:hypothetical protein
VCGGVPHIPVMHLHDTGKKHGEESNKEQRESKYVLEGVVSHKWQPCSTSNDTIVKSLSSQPLCRIYQDLRFL